MLLPNSSKDTDRHIIRLLLQSGSDKRRRRDFILRYAYFVREGINKYGISEEEAFKLYSDSVLAIIASVSNGAFQERSSLKTYLYQIFHNKCVDLVRKNATNKNSTNRTESISESLLYISINPFHRTGDDRQVRMEPS